MFNAKTARPDSAWKTQSGKKVFFLSWCRHHGPDEKKTARFGDNNGEYFFTDKQGLVPETGIENHTNDIVGPWDIKPLSKPNVEFKTFDPDEPVDLLKQIVLVGSLIVVLVDNMITQSFHSSDAAEKARQFAKAFAAKEPNRQIRIVTLTTVNLLAGKPMITLPPI